jgi:hypothetical protein
MLILADLLCPLKITPVYLISLLDIIQPIHADGPRAAEVCCHVVYG